MKRLIGQARASHWLEFVERGATPDAIEKAYGFVAAFPTMIRVHGLALAIAVTQERPESLHVLQRLAHWLIERAHDSGSPFGGQKIVSASDREDIAPESRLQSKSKGREPSELEKKAAMDISNLQMRLMKASITEYARVVEETFAWLEWAKPILASTLRARKVEQAADE